MLPNANLTSLPLDQWPDYLAKLNANVKNKEVNLTFPNGDTPLHVAVRAGNLPAVQALLSAGANVNALGDLMETPLHRAAYSNNAEIMQLLLSEGGSCDAARFDNEKPIHVAIMLGADAVVQSIVKHDKNQVTALGREGRSPLYAAVMKGNTKIAKLLLETGADVNELNKQSGMRVLHEAAKRDNDEMIMLLTEYNVDIKLTDAKGYTALQRSAAQTKPAIKAAKMLISYGSLVNNGNPSALTLLALEANPRSPATIEFASLLLAHGANTEPALHYLSKIEKTLGPDDRALFDLLNKHQPQKNSVSRLVSK